MFIPFLPGFLKPHFKLDGLPGHESGQERAKRRKKSNAPVVQPLLQLFYLTLVPTNLFECLRRVPRRPQLRRQVRLRANATPSEKRRTSASSNSRHIHATYQTSFPFPLAPSPFTLASYFSRFSSALAAARIASSSFSIFFRVFSSSFAPPGPPGPTRVPISARNSSSESVFNPCFLIAASLEGPALSPRTTYDVLEEGWRVTRLCCKRVVSQSVIVIGVGRATECVPAIALCEVGGFVARKRGKFASEDE